ncbi:TSUP family transporter [Streptococcus fryi]
MTNELILRIIQFILIGLMIWMFMAILQNARRHKVKLTERFFTGFWIGYVTDLLDTLGIGTFATTTTLFKATKLVEDDRKIPATMATAHGIPVLLEALLFITIVEVDTTTLVCMAFASFLGALVGTRVTKHWNTKMVQRILGILLIIAAGIMVYRMITNPGADISTEVRGLTGIKLIIGMIFDFIVGMLLTMGLGNYAPELIFFSLMGINPAIALPVMMLNAAIMLSTSSLQFIKSDRISWPGMLGIIIGGILGVLTAAFFLSHLDVDNLKILVVIIASYTGLTLLKASLSKS